MADYGIIDRRTLLQLAVAAAGASSLRALAQSAVSRAPLAPSECQKRLRGPILSIPTPFTADFKVDYAGVANMVRRAVEHGVGVFALTSGNGQYASLYYDEIKELTRTMVQAVGGRGVTIAAAGDWWTGQVQDYARHAESVGADAVQIMRPTACGEEEALAHVQAVAGGTRMAIVLHGDWSVPLLEKVVAIEQVIALKEDVTLDYYINRQRRFGKRLVIFGGGTEHRFLVAQPYGSECFYSAYAAFAPEVSMRFWRAVQGGDMKAAFDMANRYDYPFLDRWSHAFWRASLEHFGVAKRYLRPPQKSFTDAQMKDVAAFYDSLGLQPPAAKG